MKKPGALIISSVSLLALLALGTRQSVSQVTGSLPAYVKLQAATPGTPQVGHSNITGTVKAGQFQGGGAGLTNVNADLLDGINSTSFLQAVPNPLNLTGSVSLNPVIRGTNTSTAIASSGVMGESTALTGAVVGVLGKTVSSTGKAVYGLATSSSGVSYAGYFDNSSLSGFGVHVTSANIGIHAEGAVGGEFTTSSTTGSGITAESTATTGLNYGVFARANSALGFGVYSFNTSTDLYGTSGYFGANSPSGTAIFAETFGTEAIGGYMLSRAVDGIGVFGFASSSTGSGTGGYFVSNGPTGRAVFARSQAATGLSYGARFETDSTSGRAVYGLANSGVVGSVPYGVRGQASTATSGYGVFAVGDSGASGVKSFRIDHPMDPENKYLLHYSSESPFPQNFYNGIVETDAQGYAWVNLPDYFGQINTNYKYQLTIVGKSFARAIVNEEISGNRFQIRTDLPHIKVSWEVKADRNDLRIQANRPTDVVLKVGAEKGKLQHPEYYNQPASMGMDYAPTTVVQTAKSIARPAR